MALAKQAKVNAVTGPLGHIWALGNIQAIFLQQAVKVRLSALPCLPYSLHRLRLLPKMIGEMQELPDDVLLLVAREVLKKEEGLMLWCKLSSACRRLWRFQLPSEPTYFLDDRLTDQGDCFS